jgi:quinol monooxygenase YgiN
MSEVVVVARAKARSGQEEAMARALTANAAESRCEDGCISYSVLRGDDGVFMAVERWHTRGEFDQHMAAPHVARLFETIGPLLEGAPEIQVLREL